jgi:hypothetical protein
LRLNTKKSLAILAFSFTAIPVWAAHVDSIDWAPARSMTIGTTQIQPGQYQLKAEEGKSELQVIAKGKVIATVPCHWTALPSKPQSSEILNDGDKVTEVQFGGRPSAVQFDQ